MKKEYIIDKLDDIEESIKVAMEIDFFKLVDNEWEKISFENFKILESKKNIFVLSYILKDINGIFNNNDNYKIRLCVSEDKCKIKYINRKAKWVYTDIKEMTIKVLNKIKGCKNDESILIETIYAEILDTKEIDNNIL